MVRKDGGRRPKSSTFPLGPSRKEAPLPETLGPETRLRIQAPGPSAPSRSLPPLASLASPGFPPLPPRLPFPLCSWEPEAATPPTHPSPTRGKDPVASPGPAEGIGSMFAKQREEREPPAARNWFGAGAPGSALRRAWNPLETRAAHGAGPVSVSPTAPPESAGLSCGGRSYGPEDTRDSGCCRSPDFAHRTAIQRGFHRLVHPREGFGDRRKDGGGRTLQWQ